MPVIDTDIVVYGSLNMQEDNITSPQGGGIDTTTLIIFTDIIAASDTLDVVSSNAADTTQTLTVTGRLVDGSIATEVYTLTGTTPVVGVTTFERVLKMVLSAACAGAVTIEEATSKANLVVMQAGTTSVRRPFYNVSSEAVGGLAVDMYEKIFFKNENSTLALTNATIAEIAGGVAANVEFYLDSTLDASDSATNRITEPVAATGNWSSATLNVANSQNHSANSAQGVWLHLNLPAGQAATNSTYTLRESGQTV